MKSRGPSAEPGGTRPGSVSRGTGGMGTGGMGTGGGFGGMGGFGKRPGMSGMGGQPIRRKPQQTLAGALFGVLIGIVLVLASPFVLWQAESQNTAKDFQSAQQIQPTDTATGYVTFQGAPTVAAPLFCVDTNTCLYAEKHEQELKTVQQEECGSVSSDSRILYETALECDDQGNCEQCYMVEKDVWTDTATDVQYGEASVGSYTVKFNDSAIMLGLQEKIVPYGDYFRDVWTYFPIPTELRVAGNASGNIISGAIDKAYVLSPFGYEQTLSELQTRDATNKWMFRGITFFMLFVGFGMIFGPISYLARLIGKVPILGEFLRDVTGFLISLISFALALVVFGVLWVVISVAKNPVVALIAVVVVVGAVVFVMKKKGEKKQTVAPAAEASAQEPPAAK